LVSSISVSISSTKSSNLPLFSNLKEAKTYTLSSSGSSNDPGRLGVTLRVTREILLRKTPFGPSTIMKKTQVSPGFFP
jgi:hypothetical protein